jgi:hypothetical protein
MRSFLLTAFGLVLLGGCQSQPPEALEAPATEAEQKQATTWFIECVKAAAATLDDHVSDAMTIANAIVSGRCAQDANRLVETYTRGETGQVKAMVQQEMFNGRLQEDAAQVVLVQRSRKVAP